jgi:hypothetical protein
MGSERKVFSLLLAASAVLAGDGVDAQNAPQSSDVLPDLPAVESQEDGVETIRANDPLRGGKVNEEEKRAVEDIQENNLPAVSQRPCPKETRARTNRRSPTVPTLEYNPTPCNPNATPDAKLEGVRTGEGLPDRWRVVSLLGYRENLFDPYSGNNVLKGDRPMWGEDWFVSLIGISDTITEPRRFRLPVGPASTSQPGSYNTFGRSDQLLVAQLFTLETVVYQGDTVFKPPDWEFRFTPVLGVTYLDVDEVGVVKANADAGTDRTDALVGVQALFVDKHLRNVSDRYDFDSFRVGVQPFITDFRGFLFQDSPIGVRLFGTRGNNRYQYNIGVFQRIEKDTNTGLNDLIERGGSGLRNDYVGAVNLYVQDFPVLGFTSQATAVYNRNREGDEIFYDNNGVIQRPTSLGLERGTDYDVTYPGISGDGKLGRYNLTYSVYGAFGKADRGLFSGAEEDIQAGFAALEFSRDFSWIRLRASAAYATPDKDPFDDQANGFDAIFENPLITGADTSFFIREPVPLIGGGRVTLSGRNGMLNNLRSSKEHGQSNFTNPGLIMAGIGADFDLTPTLRISTNTSYLSFADTRVLEIARAQGNIGREIGVDASVALTWRPMAIQNVVLRLSGAALIPADGFQDLFGNDVSYAALGNVVLMY